MRSSSLSFVLAVLLDLLTLAALVVLLRSNLIPQELGTGLLGALIGARARWLSDGSLPPTPPAPPAPPTSIPRTGGREQPSHIAREALHESVIGALFFWPVWRRGGA